MRRFFPGQDIVVDVVLGIIVGGVVALFATNLMLAAVANSVFTTVNGWSTTMQAGKPGNSILVRAAIARVLPAITVAQEGVYWTTTVDSTGQTLNSQHDYILHFPPGGLPQNDAFWSLTMTNAQQALVANPINRYSLGDRSGLVPNADGSIDIYIQNASPTGRESNWLPAPSGNFKLWLRVFQPGQAILNGSYQVPPVTEVK